MSLEEEIIELKKTVAKHEELYKAIVNALSAHEVVSSLATNLDKVFEAAEATTNYDTLNKCAALGNCTVRANCDSKIGKGCVIRTACSSYII